ncbi:hypothetical protein FPQ18DRAFT_308615 [Pyronema domesticum]|uniref:Uncharacterized protein n=1 Tax=Pyronema omphalodes (strain CBS 100304) TaxID=1076935 RepID=U4LNG8_PYROM|nr:hypothetical protein FPQ18DRAFT_308615 [Pyronema domesticum]CCX15935.1 Protein of unknown function [Pyronema omphalodes CBS 100304]
MDHLQATPADRHDQIIDGHDLPVDLRDGHIFRSELCRFSMPTNPHPIERQIICLRLPHKKQNCSNNLYVGKDSTDKWVSGICHWYQPSTNGRKVFTIIFLPFREYHDQQQASTETIKRVHNGVSVSSMHAPAVYNPSIGFGPLDTGRFKTKESCYVDFSPTAKARKIDIEWDAPWYRFEEFGSNHRFSEVPAVQHEQLMNMDRQLRYSNGNQFNLAMEGDGANGN